MASPLKGTIGPEIRIKVTMNGNSPIYELWEGQTYRGEVSAQWIIEMIQHLAGALRWEK
ncbi:hypothetical protein [Rhizobium lusitanum]|uniref:hypothetical protein n=1 Tax=Rhizobium lusitanum TaxID=293958 RepID=UPI001959335D|nr:hypothetical protein [Rhizobium lusitanum]MBM7047593.1 hypothetical protein [Rhizobium lusitanum]